MTSIPRATQLLSDADIEELFNNDWVGAINIVREAMRSRLSGEVIFPGKVTQMFDIEIQDRINCMPASLVDANLAGVKWVSVFPRNPQRGVANVNGIMILSEISYGLPLAVLGAGTMTSIRTAAVGATAAELLAPREVKKIGCIGAGSEAAWHISALLSLFPSVRTCAVSSKSGVSAGTLCKEKSAKFPCVEFLDCGSDLQTAILDADVIITATSAQEPLLKADWIKPGSLYIHVGGWEDELAVVEKATLIICDDWESVKHRGSQTLSKAFKAGILQDDEVFNLDEYLQNAKPKREENDIVYFNSVGLSFIDVAFANYFYLKSLTNSKYTSFSFCG